MTGGLIQLVTTGIQDSPLIGNPEITFFKTVYRQHTMFSLCQNNRYIGTLEYGKEGNKIIEKNGDLLYSQYFKLEIPFFDIIKKISKVNKVEEGYNINELSIKYMNMNCIVLYCNNYWYIVPEKLFELSSFKKVIQSIDSNDMVYKLLPEYITITELNSNVMLYQIDDSDISSLISVLRLNSNFWEQFWLDNITNSSDFKMMNQMLTLKSQYTQLYNSLKYRIFNLFSFRNVQTLNSNYMIFEFPIKDMNDNNIYDDYGNFILETETERYYEYIQTNNNPKKILTNFDIDVVYKYCQNNFLNFNEYRDNYLEYNSLIISMVLKLLYATPNILFTFWKKYNVEDNNIPNTNILIESTHLSNEWQQNLNNVILELFSVSNLKNQLLDEFKTIYLATEVIIDNLFYKLMFDDPQTLYTKLKTIISRYYSIPFQQLNFNTGYLATNYDKIYYNDFYNKDNYYYSYNIEQSKFPSLNYNINNLDKDEMNNMTPVDLTHIYSIITNEVIDLLFENSDITKGIKSFLILWRNSITSRLYRKFLDEYNNVVTSGNMVDSNKNRDMMFYYSITPSNFFRYFEYKNSFYEMFYKNSWLSRLNLNNTLFSKFKNTIHIVNINNLFDTDFTEYTDKEFHKLKINNIYNYTYYTSPDNFDLYDYYIFNSVIYDKTEMVLYIKYDNYYNNSSKIILLIENTIYNYKSIEYVLKTNELNTKTLYLKFDLSNNIDMTNVFENYVLITLDVTYETDIPLVTFYKDNIVYNNIKSERYYILEKYSNNEIKTNNISNNRIYIDSVFDNTSILFLTINYLDYENIIPPILLSNYIYSIPSQSNKSLNLGKYKYAITYNTTNSESDLSNIVEITIDNNMIVNIFYPETDNKNVKNIKIYRTKLYDNKFYLVSNLTQESVVFFDNIPDDMLGIEYNIESNIKTNQLLSNNNITKRTQVYLEESNQFYSLFNIDGTRYTLPTNYSNIKDIYIDSTKIYDIFDESKFINNNGMINFIDINDFSSNYLYYLVNSNNMRDICKLTLLYNNVPIQPLKLSINTKHITELTSGVYKYKVTFYNSITGIESLASEISLIRINNGDGILIDNFSSLNLDLYDSWNIYRTDVDQDIFYYFTTIYGLDIQVIDGISPFIFTKVEENQYIEPSFNITKQIYNGQINNPSTSLILTDLQTPGEISPGNYKYLFTYYNISEESLNSIAISIQVSSYTSIQVQIPELSTDMNIIDISLIIGIRVYRTKKNGDKFYRIRNITNLSSLIFTDNTNDSNLRIMIPKTFRIMRVPFQREIIINPTKNLILEQIGVGSLLIGIYKYVYTFYTNKSYEQIESNKSKIMSIVLTSNSNIKITIPTSFNNNVSGRKLYRTKLNDDTFYLVADIKDNTTSDWIDNINDSKLDIMYDEKILNITPNLNSFISHSTDINYINTKKLSDMSDYIFNKPFIMLTNNTDDIIFNDYNELVSSFTNDFVYFYNVPFKINESSVISLNNNIISYVLPISSQQFFTKEPNEIYFTNNNNNIIESEPIQRTFNPAFDEFNLSKNFIINSLYSFYYDAMIYNMIDKIDNIVSSNNDYIKCINIMDQSIESYLNIFTKMIDYNNMNLLGLTSQSMLYNLDIINKYPILNYDYNELNFTFKYYNFDFLRYSHYSLRLVDDNMYVKDSEIINTNSDINVLSPVYNYYSSSKKVTNFVYDYLYDVNKMFINHKKYINDNIDYLNLSNPNNYEEKYLSLQEINQHIFNNFKTYSGNNIINPLYEIYDNNFYKIIINNDGKSNIISNFTITNNNIVTTEFRENIINSDYNDTNIIQTNRSLYRNDKFNYIGIISLDQISNIIFNDTYLPDPTIEYIFYKFDDNNIHVLYTNVGDINRYYVDSTLTDYLVVNPFELEFNDTDNLQHITLTRLSSNRHIYIFEIEFDSEFNYSGNTNFLINGSIISGKYENNKLFLFSNLSVEFSDNYLVYEEIPSDKTSYQISPLILQVNIIDYKVVNYYIESTKEQLGIQDGDIYYFNYKCEDVFNIIEYDNKCYFRISSNRSSIVLDIYNKTNDLENVTKSSVIYKIKPSLIIKNNYIYDYYNYNEFSKEILNVPDNHNIMMIDNLNKRYFLLHKNEIVTKQIPHSNYHTWILPSQLNLIKYNVQINIDQNGNISGINNIPTYSFYMIKFNNDTCIYYYEKGDTINIYDDITYYSIRSTDISEIYMIDNSLFNTELKQMISIYKTYSMTENNITKKITINNGPIKIDSINKLMYHSNLNNIDYNIHSYDDNSIQLIGDNEVIVRLILENNNGKRIYHPIVLKKYEEYDIPTINFTYNNISYSKSFIPIDTTNIFDNSKRLINDLIIGSIDDVNITSISPSIKIDNNNIILKAGYTIDDLSYNLRLWKLKANNEYYIYFWILFTNDTNMIENYLSVLGVSEPSYLNYDGTLTIENYCSEWNLLYCYPNILIQDNTNLLLNLTTNDSNLFYNFYTDTRYNDLSYNHSIKTYDFNNIISIKPTIEFLSNNKLESQYFYMIKDTYPSIYNNSKYFICIYNINNTKQIKVILSSNFENEQYFDFDSSISELSIYYSLNYPLFVNNNIIILQKSDIRYEIVKYEYLYLEQNEIIVLDNCYFIVDGLNFKSNTYQLKLINTITLSKTKYNGYFTLGNYLRKDNKIFPNIDYENILVYKPTYNMSIGEIYVHNNMINVSTSENEINDCFVFQESSLKLKLFYSNNSLYFFDNLIKIKNFDKILCTINNTVYNINNIRDGELLLNDIIELDNMYNDTFVEFILPYQPFNMIYVNLDENGKILSHNIDDNITLIINDTLYYVENNSINIIINSGYYWGKMIDTKYKHFFSNDSYIPDNITTLNITNNYPISIITEYDSENNMIKISNPNLLSSFNFYYMQPLFFGGTYNFVKKVYSDGNNYWIQLIKSTNITNNYVSKVIFTPIFINEKEYFSQYKLRYNFAIQPYDYNKLSGIKIEVIRFVLKNNEVILVQTKINNKKIIFTYGISIEQNEKDNKIVNRFGNNKYSNSNDEYKSIYFYNYYHINMDGYIDNIDTLHGSYHLYLEMYTDFTRINLCQIIYPNTLYTYKTARYNYNYNNYIDRTIPVQMNYFGEFTYGTLNITQNTKLMEINNNMIQLIKKYNIRFIGLPQYVNNMFKHQIEFINIDFLSHLYNIIYIDEMLVKPYTIINQNNNYYILSPTYLSNITTIYSSLKNYIYKSRYENVTKKSGNMMDNTIDFYIDTKYINNEIIPTSINVSKIYSSNNINKYKYKLNDVSNNFILNPNEKYNIQYVNQEISSINNNNNTIIIKNLLDSYNLEKSDEYEEITLFTIRDIDTNNIFNPTRLFDNVKRLQYILFNESKLSDNDIFPTLKPWKDWSVLNSIITVNNMTQLVNNYYLQYYQSNVIKKINNSVQFSYLTNNESNMLTHFLISINKSQIVLENFKTIRNNIEPLILHNLKYWLNNPSFFLNVTDNINSYLLACGYNNITFTGINLIFNNDTTPDIYMNEIASYITNEYTFDEDNMIVYRSTESFQKINNTIDHWINKKYNTDINFRYFGISIHKLLRLLVKLGEEFIKINNNFTKLLNGSPEYPYNNPLKFIINKIWENNYSNTNLKLLDKNFQQDMTYTLSFNQNTNIYSSINFLINLDLSFFGIYSINDYNEYKKNTITEYNTGKITEYKNTFLKPVRFIKKLNINTLFPYKINFNTNEITSNATYSIDFINGEHIANDLTINNPNLYPNQLNFNSDFNILPYDFITVKKKGMYNITDFKFKGYNYTLNFDNIDFIDVIYFRNYELSVVNKNNFDYDILIPLKLSELANISEINTNDMFEIRNNVLITKYNVINNNQYIQFINEHFNYIIGNTLLKTNNMIYILEHDDEGYYIVGQDLESFDVTIVNIINPTSVTNNMIGHFNITIDSDILNSNYYSVNNNIIIPIDFKLSNNNNSLTPLKVKTISSNIVEFVFSNIDIEIINSTTWTNIINIKRIGHDITNKINKIEKIDNYMYYFNYIIPKTNNTTIYIYDTTTDDIDINNSIYEPTIKIDDKTSISMNHDKYTYFILPKLFNFNDITDKLAFIQKNKWTITIYSIKNNIMTFNVPSDFIINVDSNYYYTINSTTIDKKSFIYNGNTISFSWNDNSITGNIIFNQYYIESQTGIIQIPENNQKIKVTFDFPYQYNILNKFYIVPYDSSGNEFNNYFYKIKTNESSELNGFGQVTFNDTFITLYENGNIYKTKLFDEYYDGSFKYYIITIDTLLDTELSYSYNLGDDIIKPIDELTFYQDLLFTAQTPTQNSSNYIYLYSNDMINNYMVIDNTSVNANHFYLVSYSDYKLTNTYYNPSFVQNLNMVNKTSYTTEEYNVIEKPKFKSYQKLFQFIKLYFNEQLMEEINEYIFNINYYLYSTEEQRRQHDKITQLRITDTGYEFYIPLIYWFNKKAGLSIPFVSLPYTEIRLNYKLNNIESFIENNLGTNYQFSNNPKIKINLLSEFILLDTTERKLFGSYSHEYVVERYIISPYNYIDSESTTIVKNWSGLIKDIHMISEPLNDNVTYFQEIINDFDYKYQRYIDALKFYNLYKKYGYYTSLEQKEYGIDINIIEQNEIDFSKYMLSKMKTDTPTNVKINNYIQYLSCWSIWDDSYELLKYILYFEKKFLSFIPQEEIMINITLYLKYLYSNNKIIRQISPIQSITFKVNGTELFPERDWVYYNSVIPYNKFKNSLPIGYYTYTFSLYPTDEQFSGHLNFSFFDDIVVKIKSNLMGTYKLNTILKEYNILRIMGGMGNLAWIE